MNIIDKCAIAAIKSFAKNVINEFEQAKEKERQATETVCMDLIWRMKNDCVKNNGKYPDNVMIHPSQKEQIYNEAKQVVGFVVPNMKDQRIFGMKVIWTSEIDEDVAICTYNGK